MKYVISAKSLRRSILIVGTGIDIVEIHRIQKALNKSEKFIHKICIDEEIEYLKSRNLRPEYIAGRFAAKEAVSKCLGTGFQGFNFTDIVIKKDSKGKPEVELLNGAKHIAESFGEYKIHLSISHSCENAIAYAVIEVI